MSELRPMLTPKNSRGATPATVMMELLIRTVRLTISGLPPKRRIQ